MRWLERLVVHHWGHGFSMKWAMRNVNIFSDNLFGGIEDVCAFYLLGEWFVLFQCFTSQSFIGGEYLRSIKVVLHVRNLTRESCFLANSSPFDGIGHDISWWNHDLVIVFWISETLLNIIKVFHMEIG